jgi:hypothetical protein
VGKKRMKIKSKQQPQSMVIREEDGVNYGGRRTMTAPYSTF